MRLLLVDNNKEIRDGIKNLLRRNPEIVITETFHSLLALHLALEHDFDAILIYAEMPIVNGNDFTKYLLIKKPKSVIIGTFLDFNIESANQMTQNGAKKCIHKADLNTSLLEKIFQELHCCVPVFV